MRKLPLVIGLISVSVMAIACIPLIPYMGFIGAAVVCFVTAGLLWVSATMYLRKPL